MTRSELEAIRGRLKKASSGPWAVKRVGNLWRSHAGDRRTHPCVRAFRVPKRIYEVAPEQVERDAAFMAGARQDIPALLAEFDRLCALLHETRVALGQLSDSNEDHLRLDIERVARRISHIR